MPAGIFPGQTGRFDATNYPPVPARTHYPTYDQCLTAPQKTLDLPPLRCLKVPSEPNIFSQIGGVFDDDLLWYNPSQRVTLPEIVTVRLPLKIRPKPPKERIIHSNHWIFWFWTYAVFWFWVQLFFQPFFKTAWSPRVVDVSTFLVGI